MTIQPILILLLLAHVIGDFYLQTKNMAEKKNVSKWWLLRHSGLYSLCMIIILLIGVAISWYWLLLVLGTIFSHLLIDYLKRYIPKKPFVIDQLLHLIMIIVLWWLWGQYTTIRELSTLQTVLNMFGRSATANVLTLLGLLIILKPVGLLIEKGEVWNFNKIPTTPDENQKGAGKMIGYLERIIVFFLLINNQFGAIAFVLTAKSVMRFPEIGKSNNASSLVEFYIIGTLLSMTSVFIVAFLLGLIQYN